MKAPNRRLERQPELLKDTLLSHGVPVTKTLDLTDFENRDMALEGTGSLILDRVHEVAFAIESPRADREPFMKFCKEMGYYPLFFHAVDKQGKPIYHTNVMLSIGEKFAAVCEDAIPKNEVIFVKKSLRDLEKNIIPVTMDQMVKYGANILELKGSKGPIIIASETAVNSYTREQLYAFERYGELISFHIPVIETIGGGSARCILAEAFPGSI